MTPSEKFVSALCQNTFLPFWSFSNPIGKNGKELCDILVVCEPDVIIFSVKDISVKESGNEEVDVERWLRNAIDESVNQIYGAERIIQLKEEILLKDRKTKIKLPEKGIRNIYRVAVAFGRGEKFPLKYGEFGKGFVHVYDEKSIHIILRELNTITDFINYLKDKEELVYSGARVAGNSGEDFLAFYLRHGFDSIKPNTYLYIDDGLWNQYIQSKEYFEEKMADSKSYLWDGLIKEMYHYYSTDTLINPTTRDKIETTLRIMNRETRYQRRRLGDLTIEFFQNCLTKAQTGARIIKAETTGAPIYVLQSTNFESRKTRMDYLAMRCMVARSIYPDSREVIGIATEIDKKDGHSYDICYIDVPELDEKMKEDVNAIVEEFGFFKNMIQQVK